MLSSHTIREIVQKGGKKEEEEDVEEECPNMKSSPGKATSDQIQKVLDCLQPHMDDPDVQGEYTEPELVRLVVEMQHFHDIFFIFHILLLLVYLFLHFRLSCGSVFTSSSSSGIVSSSEGSTA